MTSTPDPTSIEALVARALSDPAAARDYLDRLDAEQSLRDFVRLLWPVLEPGRPLVGGWCLDAICEHLEAVTKGQIRKLLVNIPPGTMKSLSLVFWPAWEWGPRNLPSMRYVCASYAESLTLRDNRKCRALVQSEAYQQKWGDRVKMSPDQAAKGRFENTATGFRLATSIGGVGTGERGDRFIVDDPHSVREGESEAKREQVLQWFTEVVPSRVVDPEKSAFIVIMQRVHSLDVSGLILSKQLGYEHLCLPMEYEPDRQCRTSIGFFDPRKEAGELLWPERFSRDYLERDLKPSLSARGGSYAVAGQLQQRPTPRGGGMFKRQDFRVVEAAAPSSCLRARGWDLAATRDGHGAYTVGVKMARTNDGRTVVEDVVRIRGSPGEVRKLVLATTQADGATVDQSIPQDPGQAGVAQKEAFAALLAGFPAFFTPETGSKEDRARPLAAQVEAGMVDLVRAPWNDSFVAEAASFPMGEHKDQVDASSRAFAHLVRPRMPLASVSGPMFF